MMKRLVDVFILAVLIEAGHVSGDGADVRSCGQNPPYYPRSVVKTGDRIERLREKMKKENLAAYIVPSTDSHGNEYVKERDKRREFISGFSGSAGTAIVTMKSGSALWTDGRYFLQADKQLDCNWILQKKGRKGVPSQSEWLKQVLNSGDVVGIDPFLRSIDFWDKTVKTLKKKNITLRGVQTNLVDAIWTGRPKEEKKKIVVHPFIYTGKRWYDKVVDVQKKMKEEETAAHVVQSLDSIAWLLNLRGDEISYNPVFFAYVIVKMDEVLFFVDGDKISSKNVQDHLQLRKCSGKSYCVKTKSYDSVVDELHEISNNLPPDTKIWFSPTDSHALRQRVADDKVYLDYSPIILMKGKKNKVELEGMKRANLKDSVALAEFFLYAEKQVAKKANITELSLGEKMIEFRSKQALYKGLSFPSIIGFGPNSAVIHYTASKKTDRRVTNQSTLLVDTGSQYLEGTTDVTRSVHFGTPTAKQKSAFTRVLMGHIDVAKAFFPQGTYGRALEIFQREPLYRNGWNYRHGSGHGIGSYLYIHEGPGWFAPGCPTASEKPLDVGFVITDEPGFYEDGDFGVRIETTLTVENGSTSNRFDNVDYLKFEPICYFPIQRKLIDETIMSDHQLKWLNDYHKKTAELVGPELKRQGKMKEYDWLIKQTKPIFKNTDVTASSAITTLQSISLFLVAVAYSSLYVDNPF
ncbi:xaa-Pro aminopeptidase 1-like [Dendronephthya gigantea]|uniref:xaa-Pro aminopeptidase 1-like n=1 Tax=Dendronephthya gigantea TaxID=151771 RepID=UPI00106C7AF1|nr:xaa-Pro aminopeptidase 1-like [Dendronephthya gigantea]